MRTHPVHWLWENRHDIGLLDQYSRSRHVVYRRTVAWVPDLPLGTWMDHTNARDADMMQVPDVGAFVRALLPVHLTEVHQITYGVARVNG